jgi:hypothetical protein
VNTLIVYACMYIYIYIHFTRHGNHLGMQLTHVAPTRSSSNFLCAARRAALVPCVATRDGVVHARVLSTLLFYVSYTMINVVSDTIVILCVIVLPPPYIVATRDIIIEYVLVININRTTTYKCSPPPPPYEMFLMFQYSNTHTMLYNMCYYISFLQALASISLARVVLLCRSLPLMHM